MNIESAPRIGLTRDFLTPDGQLTYCDIGLSLLENAPHTQHEFLARHEPTIAPDQLRDFDAIISLTPQINAHSLQESERLTAILRFGVGYDMVDVEACTNAEVLLCITAGAVNYSVAEATIGWMLALCHRAAEKDKLARSGGWAQRGNFMGGELRDKTLGVVGLGGIGKKLIEMLRVFDMKTPLIYDPFVAPETARECGARAVSLDELLRASDFVSVNCPLTASTRGLIGSAQLALMKPTSFLINTARGG